MKERPIIFSSDTVRAILEGRKTQTRRVVKPQPDLDLDDIDRYDHIEVGNYYPALIDKDGEMYPGDEIFGAYTEDGEWGWKFPYGKVGDRLWVRESFYSESGDIWYKTDGQTAPMPIKWKPSIYMPRWASRITREIAEVRVERIQEITNEDAKAEGVIPFTCCLPGAAHYITPFKELWDSINAKRGYGWDTNCWVWVISFRRISND